MSDTIEPKLDINSWLEEELYQEYLSDQHIVDESWKEIFETANGHPKANIEPNAEVTATEIDAGPPTVAAAISPAAASVAEARPMETAPVQPSAPPPSATTAAAPEAAAPAAGTAVSKGAAVSRSAPPPLPVGPGEQLVPLRGAAARIADNMRASLSIPVATSQRVIPVKVIDENRRIINDFRTLHGKNKISYTHLVGWAIVRGVEKVPSLNSAYAENEGEPFRAVRSQLNLGIAVDVAGKDGNRSLLVPSIKNAGAMSFDQFIAAYDDLVARARTGKLTIQDFEGTTISLTNPGTVGTVGSIPRLMPGQGAIIATGVIDYPAEYQGVSDAIRNALGISKIMGISCTYDHRVIQGAESGMFLAYLQSLLQGENSFYERIFADLKMAVQPVRWEPDRRASVPGITTVSEPSEEVAKQAAVLQLINAYRVRGHLIADLDPLGSDPVYHPELDPNTYGLTIWDLDRPFLTGTLGLGKQMATLREILDTLRRTYCGRIGCEYMNIQHPEQKAWLQQRMEPNGNGAPLDANVRRRILERVIQAEQFEHFLHARFVGHKRFSLEGAESAIAILDELLDRAANHHVHEAVIGMAHRGRLNVLANIIGKSMIQLFSEFEGDIDPESTQGSGDVKYHLGASGVRRSTQNREITVSVAFNPSHLEAVDPVVEGIVRPKQDRLGDTARERVIPILIHGDAAFAGQGVVAETLNLSQLDGYCTGGTIHLIINNQIGFTTNPNEARSTPYSTDVARMVQSPIFHVNGDDPDACLRVTQMAFDYRQQFKKDVVIDMFCYRRHGHNEADDPSYTQPILYRKIRQQPSVATIYAERLQREGLIQPDEVQAMRKLATGKLNSIYDAAQQNKQQYELQELSAVSGDSIPSVMPHTAADRALLEQVVEGITTFPEDFHLHPKLRGFIEKRKEALNGGSVDWALAEALAFGSLVLEGTPVRLSGQDSGRGTFSQRHLQYYDSENGHEYCPLKYLAPDQARFDVYDSSLSEYAVMGFEFGYSVADPLTLVLWEAQFGDFANGAQVMIDQFIASAESKWGQPSGLVLLLPHGYEGQGPEHSSARIERYLQLCAEDNMQVCNCTTPAQYFHLLRRQMYGGPDRRGMRKPLIVFTPKSLLRFPRAASTLDDLSNGGFHEIFSDPGDIDANRVSKVLVCSGKVYYDLAAARDERELRDVAILRVEQLYPFPRAEFSDLLMRYPLTAEVIWVQEEPRNMGAWGFIEDQIQPLLEATRRKLRYAGRPEGASPASGSLKRHQQEQIELVEEAFSSAPLPRKGRMRLVPKKKTK
ncbi:MAG TPA: multifunctional oxoglutarate decarboxylase/oxoglutarate dehydrogenase thiamine pyrophosphate-binding subunit/dihydrolipoyllysine-residue succinyltransferase subunit [Bryobacteraceae bacterium]|nr:multifunctional oxoglutarate decarboxylase/oxoglutarate dehydrogenase thiamine pyrophosphate-binding subunit/dihydrolipoyllysine-residue succinyltransferase subunit [Bryobacteraceae bacterium]